jgi:hypothetical protein
VKGGAIMGEPYGYVNKEIWNSDRPHDLDIIPTLKEKSKVQSDIIANKIGSIPHDHPA